MNISETTDILARIDALPVLPEKPPVDEIYGKYPIDTVIARDAVKEKAGDSFDQGDWDRMEALNIRIHGVLCNIKMDGMNRSPLVYQCSYNGHRLFAYRDSEMGTSFFFLQSIREKDMLYAYCDLLFNNTAENQMERFFAYLSDPEAYIREHKDQTLDMLVDLKKEGYIVENIRICENSINITIHATITLPEGLRILNRPSLLPYYDDGCWCEYDRQRVDIANEDICAHRYTFVQQWSWERDEKQWLISTDCNHSLNTHECDYLDRLQHHVVPCDTFTLHSVKRALETMDRITHSEIPDNYDFYRMTGRRVQTSEGKNVLTLSATKRKWWIDPSQPEKVRKWPREEVIIKEGKPRTFITDITHTLIFTIKRESETFHVEMRESVTEKISPAKMNVRDEDTEITRLDRTISETYDKWDVLTHLQHIARELTSRY